MRRQVAVKINHHVARQPGMQNDTIQTLHLLRFELHHHEQPFGSLVIVQVLLENLPLIRIEQPFNFRKFQGIEGSRCSFENHIGTARIQLSLDLLEVARVGLILRCHVTG